MRSQTYIIKRGRVREGDINLLLSSTRCAFDDKWVHAASGHTTRSTHGRRNGTYSRARHCHLNGEVRRKDELYTARGWLSLSCHPGSACVTRETSRGGPLGGAPGCIRHCHGLGILTATTIQLMRSDLHTQRRLHPARCLGFRAAPSAAPPNIVQRSVTPHRGLPCCRRSAGYRPTPAPIHFRATLIRQVHSDELRMQDIFCTSGTPQHTSCAASNQSFLSVGCRPAQARFKHHGIFRVLSHALTAPHTSHPTYDTQRTDTRTKSEPDGAPNEHSHTGAGPGAIPHHTPPSNASGRAPPLHFSLRHGFRNEQGSTSRAAFQNI
ncbi:unnamed protein product [Pleuronectes platessa]|uniref:Uncharacterized protein n=1 Tax=Pleuronectes platessa TaxID=8262 RepID=A0A9N7UWD2_PLEPL|nr:unnamed protein product [Pleuronectes platessa]